MVRGDYTALSCRVRELDLEAGLLTGSTEPIPVDPFDPELD